jgi:hypothetical protein
VLGLAARFGRPFKNRAHALKVAKVEQVNLSKKRERKIKLPFFVFFSVATLVH